jgi:hypothetical protein
MLLDIQIANAVVQYLHATHANAASKGTQTHHQLCSRLRVHRREPEVQKHGGLYQSAVESASLQISILCLCLPVKLYLYTHTPRLSLEVHGEVHGDDDGVGSQRGAVRRVPDHRCR